MLKELWVKMHREEDWRETQATVRNVQRYEDIVDYGEIEKYAEITFRYTDHRGELQYGSVTVPESSVLFDREENSVLFIRYNAARPDECVPVELEE